MGVIQRASTPRVGKYSNAEVKPEMPPSKSRSAGSLATNNHSFLNLPGRHNHHRQSLWGRAGTPGNGGRERKSNLIDRGWVPPRKCQQNVWKDGQDQDQSQPHIWIPQSKVSRFQNRWLVQVLSGSNPILVTVLEPGRSSYCSAVLSNHLSSLNYFQTKVGIRNSAGQVWWDTAYLQESFFLSFPSIYTGHQSYTYI